MTKYEIGIMSSKWIVEAPSLDVAIITVRLATKTSAPIVCYNSEEQSKFSFEYTVQEFKDFCDEHVDDIRVAYRAMEAVS